MKLQTVNFLTRYRCTRCGGATDKQYVLAFDERRDGFVCDDCAVTEIPPIRFALARLSFDEEFVKSYFKHDEIALQNELVELRARRRELLNEHVTHTGNVISFSRGR